MMQRIEEKFATKRALATHKKQELFGVFDEDLTEDERLALKYLYAYMPLNDLADYDSGLFLSHVRAVLKIQRTVPWGERVPHDIFLHFILPYRVNNENIDDIREIFFEEIFPRVQDMSMEDAILETNHWCHEKANYIGNDRRTVSPLTLIRTAIGRCGEQSTLAVAALRSIGIPARQVYTPLWAHSDSNHAWVEAWADGKWHFFGACEPEARLNQGWFESPARRAMLVHTRVATNYPGPEEVTLAHPWYSELNLTNLYATTKTIKVKVVDAQGSPTKATIQFQLFNFGGFRPLLTIDTDNQGEVDVSLGQGDVYLSVSNDDGWAFIKHNVAESDQVTVKLSTDIQTDGVERFSMLPPPDIPENKTVEVSEEEKAVHDEQVKKGAAIRANFEATFLTEEDAEEIATAYDLPNDRVWNVLKPARGNSFEIAAYLQEYAPAYGIWALRLLEVLNEKDLTDTFRDTLADHLIYAMKVKERTTLDDDAFAASILRPRVDFEMLTPYRGFFQEAFTQAEIDGFIQDPHALVSYIDESFETVPNINFYQGSATPLGSFKLKKGDKASRDILFVAMARSFGIPARLDPSDKYPQLLLNDKWQNIHFKGQATSETTIEKVSDEMGTVRWEMDDETDTEIKYMSNFTLSRFTDGGYQALFYKSEDIQKETLAFPTGNYRLATSRRLKDGTSLVQLRYFTVLADEETSVPVEFPVDTTEVPVIADAKLDFQVESVDGNKSEASAERRQDGTTFVWIEPDREPSKHLLREFREMKDEWEELDIRINCFISEEKWNLTAALREAGDLPRNISFFKETNTYDGMETIGMHTENPPQAGAELPVVYVLDKDGQIRHISQGYKLGISRDVLDVYKQILEG